MRATKTILAATIGLTATALLASCSTATTPHKITPNEGATTAAVAETPNAKPEEFRIKITKVIDPLTVVGKRTDDDDPLKGKKVTVEVNNLVTPTKNECGYDKAMIFAKNKLLDGTFVVRFSHDDDGIFQRKNGDYVAGLVGFQGLGGYAQDMISDGMGYNPNRASESPFEDQAQADAKASKIGLWASCPGFGDDAPAASYKEKLAEDAFAKRVKSDDEMSADVVDVIDLTHFTVAPTEFDVLNGYSGSATVTLPATTTFVAPEKGECGYDQAVAYARDFFAKSPEIAINTGAMRQDDDYWVSAARDGYVYTTDPRTDMARNQSGSKSAKTGLWGSCPGFGADAASSQYDY